MNKKKIRLFYHPLEFNQQELKISGTGHNFFRIQFNYILYVSDVLAKAMACLFQQQVFRLYGTSVKISEDFITAYMKFGIFSVALCLSPTIFIATRTRMDPTSCWRGRIVKPTTYCLLLPRLSCIRVNLMPLICLHASFRTQSETLPVSFFYRL